MRVGADPDMPLAPCVVDVALLLVLMLLLQSLVVILLGVAGHVAVAAAAVASVSTHKIECPTRPRY